MKKGLARLLAFETSGYPVISLYLDVRNSGCQAWLHRALERLRQQIPPAGPQRESFEADVRRVLHALEKVSTGTRGVAVFACHGEGLFHLECFPRSMPNHLVVKRTPYLYPLASLLLGNDYCPIFLSGEERAALDAVARANGRAKRSAG